MTYRPAFFCASLGLAMLLTGCEFDGGIARRERERPEAYAALHVWQKRFIEQGVIAKGFTPDMVYMAMGNPSKVEQDKERQLWTYKYYYPPGDITHVRFHYYAEQPLQDRNITLGTVMENSVGVDSLGAHHPPLFAARGGVATGAFLPAPPQGGSIEPADLQSYTIQVLFEGGKVTQIGAKENIN